MDTLASLCCRREPARSAGIGPGLRRGLIVAGLCGFLVVALPASQAEAQSEAETSPAAPAVVEPPPLPPEDSPDEARRLLRRAIDLYIVGRYADAADTLRPLVEKKILRDRADQKEALRAYGISLFLSGGRAGAERAFRELLRLDPAERLDPTFVRPEVVAFFEEVRRAHQAELAALVQRRTPRFFVANLLPPWGQFQNRHRIKGYAILGGEILLTAASITTAALLYSWRDEQGRFPGHEDAYTPVSTVNYVTFAALGALLLYGMADGWYYYLRPSSPDPGPPAASPSSSALGPGGALLVW